MLLPVMGTELSNIQFRSLDEQLFRAMAVLFDQAERFGVARLVGMSAPISIKTPTIGKVPSSESRTKAYVAKFCTKLDFVLAAAQAQKQIADRAKQLAAFSLNGSAVEPMTARRQIK